MQGPPVENIFTVTLGRHAMDLKWTEVRLGAQSIRIPFIGGDMPQFDLHIPRDGLFVMDMGCQTPSEHSRLMGVTRKISGADVLIDVEGIELWGVGSGQAAVGQPAAAIFPWDSVVVLED